MSCTTHITTALTLAITLTLLGGGQSLEVSLTRVSTLYLPTYDSEGGETFPIISVTSEQLAWEREQRIIYSVGKGVIHIIDAHDVTNLTSLDHVMLPQLDLTDVEVCGEGVFVSYRNDSDKAQGGVLVYRKYSRPQGSMERLHDIPMSSLPDMVYPTKDCTLVVAMENEGYVQGGQFFDPPGGVGIIRFPSGITAEPEVKILDFTAFDDQFDRLSESGVRWVYRADGNKFSDNVEPEYIAFNHDYTTAYICLQENNAIAVVDLTTDSITNIHGLGFKQWGKLDASDRDGGIHMQDWPVWGMYQPDAIAYVRWNNDDYIITANEGDAQEYDDPVNFAEETRGKDITNFAPSVSSDLRAALQDDSKLGRLTISNVDGKNGAGQFEKFFTYGGRSFSVWRASDMTQVYDSGSQLEEVTSRLRPDVFNAHTEEDKTLNQTFDVRSDNKGPETESLAVGEVDDVLLIFAGNERPGTIAVYSVQRGGMQPVFRTLYTEGIPRGSHRTFQQMLDDRSIFAIDPEFLQFLPPSSGLADFPALLVGGSVSGTVSILKVEVTNSDPDHDTGGSTDDASLAGLHSFLTLLPVCLTLLASLHLSN